MAILIITIGILYVLGAYLMWIVGDESEPHDMKMRPYYSALWPAVVVGALIENLIMKDTE